MHLTEFVPDYILRDMGMLRGKTITILAGAKIKIQRQVGADTLTWNSSVPSDIQVEVTNFLPGFTEVYAPHAVHNHQVVWKVDDRYYNTDINNVKEVRDAGSDEKSIGFCALCKRCGGCTKDHVHCRGCSCKEAVMSTIPMDHIPHTNC